MQRRASAPSPEKACASNCYPKCLSIQDILALGKLISKKTGTVISICKFDSQHMEWSTRPEDEFASDGFRQAFKAARTTKVIGRYFRLYQSNKPKYRDPYTEGSSDALSCPKLCISVKGESHDKGFGHTSEYKRVFMGHLTLSMSQWKRTSVGNLSNMWTTLVSCVARAQCFKKLSHWHISRMKSEEAKSYKVQDIHCMIPKWPQQMYWMRMTRTRSAMAIWLDLPFKVSLQLLLQTSEAGSMTKLLSCYYISSNEAVYSGFLS